MVTKITVDIGLPVVSVLIRRRFEERGLGEGERVYLTFKTAAVHVVLRSNVPDSTGISRDSRPGTIFNPGRVDI
jgi:hypothetical protein